MLTTEKKLSVVAASLPRTVIRTMMMMMMIVVYRLTAWNAESALYLSEAKEDVENCL